MSKKLSWLLRHGAVEAGLNIDPVGWVPVTEVITYMKLSEPDLQKIVLEDKKSRYEMKDGKIRANQGHSIITSLDDLEKSWEEFTQDTPIYHGTNRAVIDSIQQNGLIAGERSHVHMAETIDSTVGKRANVQVMLKIDPTLVRERGIKLYRSPNGVILARSIPADCIVQYIDL